MAPTKPLVGQQIEACFKVMGIPQSDTVEMTGEVGQREREAAWRHKVGGAQLYIVEQPLMVDYCFPESVLPHPPGAQQ